MAGQLRESVTPLETNAGAVQFQITDFYVPEADKSKRKSMFYDDGDEPPKEFEILLFGCTGKGESVCTRVTGYMPYFYVKISDKLASMKSTLKGLHYYLLQGRYNYKTKAGRQTERKVIPECLEKHLHSMKLEYKKEFMGFTNQKEFPFLKITCKSLRLFNTLKYFFMNPPQSLTQNYGNMKAYESNIDPMLRFIHDTGILPCGWIELKGGYYSFIEEADFVRTNHALEIDYRHIQPLDIKTTAPLIIASFDIECTSSHGDFPVAMKDYTKLAKDLIMVARATGSYEKDQIISWIERAYTGDVPVVGDIKVHRLYNKYPVERIREKLEPIIEDVVDIMQRVKADDDSDSEDEEKVVLQKHLQEQENQLKRIFDAVLPKLKGDEIIQIGTTVHRYGSDEIIFKNILTLKNCEPIPGVEVESYNSEAALLYAWKTVLQRIDPDILMGYNIFGFDMPYVWDRAQELGLTGYGEGLGRQTQREGILLEQKLSSAALGDNVLRYFDMDGVVLVDMYKVMQRSALDSYKLDFVAQLYLGDQKNDIKPHEIFEKFKGSDYDRRVIAEYCLQDCALVNRLFHKLKVLENNNAMGNVCLVPLSYLFMRGQGVKIFSLVAAFCKNKNFAIPVLNTHRDVVEGEDGYEGAIVLHPKEGMYLQDAITVLDYSSLYPSSMIERNLSHDCYVNDPVYDNLPGVDYCTVSYDIYEGVGDKKKKVGEQACRFVQGEKGLIPQILMKLLTQRKNTRKKIEYQSLECKNGAVVSGLVTESEEGYVVKDVDTGGCVTVLKSDVIQMKETYNSFEQAVLDALQVAYKVTANSLYGQIGSRVSPIYLKEIAACTTATGRERILMAKKFVEEQYGAEVIYGDSVTGYTPVTLRVQGKLTVDKIEDLAQKYGDNNWIPCDDKESCEIPSFVEVWSDKGWTPIQRVIRHALAPHKKIIRVQTHTGVVDVTDDHSLLLSDGTVISPKDLVIGSSLLCAAIPSEYIQEDDSDSMVNAQKRYLNNQSNKPCIVEQIYEVPYSGYVYDLTTDNHHFQAGVGNMIVHNTDSIFCKFTHHNDKGEKISGRDTLPLGIKAGQRASKEIKSILPPPQCLEYEKTFFPFIIFSKKRYVGLLYEDDANKKPKQKSMGIVLKRRDNAPLVKKIYGGIIDILLNKYDLGASVEFLTNELRRLVQGEYDLKDLIVTKTLKAVYKDRTKIAHCVLADRMGVRDAGNKPQVNDRIPYIYIKSGDEVKLQGDKIEHPDYIRENNLTPDYQFYITNQLMKPLCQLYALCVENLPGYSYPGSYWLQIDEELSTVELYKNETRRQNRIQSLREQEVVNLLFDAFLEKKKRVRAVGGGSEKPSKKVVLEKFELGEEAPVFEMGIKENKETKEFESECSLTLKTELLWKKAYKQPKKSLTKTEACNIIVRDALLEICKDHLALLNNNGIRLKLDRYYTNVLKKLLDKQEDLLKELEQAQTENDLQKFQECSEIMLSCTVANMILKWKYVL